MKIKKIIKYETYILFGLVMMGGVVAKLIFDIYIDSDWFWFIAGVALTLEGSIDLIKQRQFNKKYKVVSKSEFEEMRAKIKGYEKDE